MLAACDPCSGIVGCSVGPHIGVSGRIVSPATGLPVPGTTVEFTRTSGASLSSNPARAVADEQGAFVVDAGASSGDSVFGFMTITPPNGSPYRILDVRLGTYTRRGDAQSFRDWTTEPVFPEGERILIRGVPAVPAAQLSFEFRRTGGVEASGLTTVRATTDTGATSSFLQTFEPQDAGAMIGELVLFAGKDTLVRRDVRIPAMNEYPLPTRRHDIKIGPSLEYHVKFNRRGMADQAVAGVTLRFDRTAGVAVSQPTWSEITGQGGSAVFRGRALASGVVTGTLTITPPAPWASFTRTGVQFATFDADTSKLHSIVWVGPGMSGLVRIRAQGAPLRNATVKFERTGGLALISPVLTGTTDANGLALITAATASVGSVTGDLTIQPPAPYAPRVVKGVMITAIDGDDPVQPPIVGEWDVAASALRASRAP